MASKGYLFVNKHSDSPSLSRNTGSEASLASKVNKHVQQQRFPQWKQTAPRQNWYRPFVRAESTGSISSPTGSDVSSTNHEQPQLRHARKVRMPPRNKSSSSNPGSTAPDKDKPRKVVEYSDDEELSIVPQEREFTTLPDIIRHSKSNPVWTSEPVTGFDPFNATAEALTPETLDILYRHLAWASSSSVTEYAVQQGKRRLFSTILQDEMHAAAFLAHATSQLRKYRGFILDAQHSPEVYTYKATKLLRKHLSEAGKHIDPYALVDVFRMCLTEWINGNYSGARTHLGFIAQKWALYKQKTAADGHNIEVISCADIFLAVDTDAKPILSLTWEPGIGSHLSKATTKRPEFKIEPDSEHDNEACNFLTTLRILAVTENLAAIIERLVLDLERFPNYSQTDFTASTKGLVWLMKRKMQASLHRILCIRDQAFTPMEQCIRRTVIILLTCGTTSAERRAGRVDMARLVMRLQASLDQLYLSEDTEEEHHIHDDPGLWLWIYVTGLAAASEEPVDTDVRAWFLNRSIGVVQRNQTAPMAIAPYEDMLSTYVFLRTVHRDAIHEIIRALRK